MKTFSDNVVRSLICTLLLSGCQSPFLVFPGGALSGETATTDSFAFADDHALLSLEVNPAEPYSVILRTTVIAGELYIDVAKGRKWGHLLAEQNKVRLRLGDKVYNAVATPVTNKEIVEKFRKARIIYRLDPQ